MWKTILVPLTFPSCSSVRGHSTRGSGTDLQVLETGEDRVHTRPDTGGVGLDVVFGNVFGDHGYEVLEPFLGLGIGWDDLFADELECLDVSTLTSLATGKGDIRILQRRIARYCLP